MAGPRRFDHDEAIRRRAAGETWASLAAEYGVSVNAVYQVVKRATDAVWAKRDRTNHREYQREHRGNCIDCGALIWHARYGTLRCPACNGLAHATSVRDDTLRCSQCGEWKPDRDFPHKRGGRARRERHQICRPCQTLVKRRERDRRSLPCDQCGGPTRTLPSERFNPDRVLCLACYQTTRRKAA